MIALTDNPAVFPAAIHAPEDGDPCTGSTFQTALQELANRTAYLDTLTETTGVKRLRQGTRAAMLATATHATGDHWLVLGEGLYTYDSTRGGDVDGFWIFAATGGGAWIRLGADLRDLANGIPWIYPMGKINPSLQSNRLVTMTSSTVAIDTTQALTAGTWTDVTNMGATVTVAANDIVQYWVSAAMDSPTQDLFFKVHADDATFRTYVAGYVVAASPNKYISYAGQFLVGATTAANVRLSVRSSVNVTATVYEGSNVMINVIRP